MRLRIMVILWGILLLAAAPVWSANLAPSTKELAKALEKDGYVYKEMRGNMAIFTNKQSVVQVSLNNKGLVYEGGISIGPKSNPNANIVALYTVYATLEVNKGRTQMLNEKVAITKMSKLMDRVEAALKVSDRTQFRFENMEVLATRNDKTGFFTIGLKPH